MWSLRLFFCLTLAATGSPSPAASTDITLQELKQRLDQFVEAQHSLHTRAKVTCIARVANGRLCEKNYRVDCVTNQGVVKISCYSNGLIDGKQQWFDIRETLLLPSGHVAEWRHPGFPGQLSWGSTSHAANRIGFDATRIGHPLFALNRIREILDRPATQIIQQNDRETIVRTSPLAQQSKADHDDNYLQIVFSKTFRDLPVSMIRYVPEHDTELHFESGAGVSIEYTIGEDSLPILTSVKRDRKLRDEFEGVLHTTWEFESFERLSRVDRGQLRMVLPYQVVVQDVDSNQRATIFHETDEAVGLLRKHFGDLIQFQRRAAAMKKIASSFVGQCPDLPAEYQRAQAKRIAPPAPAGRNNRLGLVMAHAAALVVVGSIWTRFRRKRSTD